MVRSPSFRNVEHGFRQHTYRWISNEDYSTSFVGAKLDTSGKLDTNVMNRSVRPWLLEQLEGRNRSTIIEKQCVI